MAKNKKCDPISNNFNPGPIGPPLPGPPGFGLDISFPEIPLGLPEGIPEDILSWLSRLKFAIPGGGFLQDTLDGLTKKITSIISSVLGYLNVAVGWYLFILAIIELILCIIKVLCAMPKPWSVVKAVKRLIRKCMPIFISICFPFFALLLLLMSLIAILIALIEYIISLIKRLIEQIKKNLAKLKKLYATGRIGQTATVLAIISKLSNLICLFEAIFTFLGAISAILEIITSKWSKILRGCSSKSGPGGDDLDIVCAKFMSNPIEKVSEDLEIWKSRVQSDSGNATIWYMNELYASFPLAPAQLFKVRAEAIYLQNNALIEELKFKNIISENGFPFFPFDKVISKDIDYTLKPYTIDLYITKNPGDGYGLRKIQFTDVTVTYAILDAVTNASALGVQTLTRNDNGYLILSGGASVDGYGYTDHTIDELLRMPAGNAPSVTGYDEYLNIDYSLKINYEALAQYMLITFNCFPSVDAEQAFLEQTFAKAFNFALPDFITVPDIDTAITGLTQCFSTFKSNVSPDTVDTFGTCMEDILNDLLSQANNTYCQMLALSLDKNNMPITIDPEMQFTGEAIKVSVAPTDQSGKTLLDIIGGNTPSAECMASIASKFRGDASFGNISGFSYDGYGNFIADITSEEMGDGYLSVYYDDELIVVMIKPDDLNIQPTFDTTPISYSFIGMGTGVLPANRRDETDTSNG